MMKERKEGREGGREEGRKGTEKKEKMYPYGNDF